MSRPFCSHVAMLQDGASSGAYFVNKLTLPLVDLKMNVIKWKLHALRVVQFWSEINLYGGPEVQTHAQIEIHTHKLK